MARKKLIKNLSPEEQVALRAEIVAKMEKLAVLKEQAKAEDPYWYFVPNDGVINDDRRSVLSRYLKDEDIPDKCDSQLDALLSKAPIKGISGGNRSSKTVSSTISSIIKQTGELPRDMRCTPVRTLAPPANRHHQREAPGTSVAG